MRWGLGEICTETRFSLLIGADKFSGFNNPTEFGNFVLSIFLEEFYLFLRLVINRIAFYLLAASRENKS